MTWLIVKMQKGSEDVVKIEIERPQTVESWIFNNYTPIDFWEIIKLTMKKDVRKQELFEIWFFMMMSFKVLSNCKHFQIAVKYY